MTTQEFQSQIIDSYKCKNVHRSYATLLLSVKDSPALFLQVLRNNHSWCVEKEIYTPDMLLQLDAELLFRGGFATQQIKPASFDEPVEVGNNVWAPFNHGGSLDNINGSYQGFDEALTLDYGTGWRQPTMLENCALASTPNMFGIYAGSFGRVFEGQDGNIFLPASGLRRNSSSGGNFYNVGTTGYYWASSVYDATSSFGLRFDESNGAIPRLWLARDYGLPVRCVKI